MINLKVQRNYLSYICLKIKRCIYKYIYKIGHNGNHMEFRNSLQCMKIDLLYFENSRAQLILSLI